MTSSHPAPELLGEHPLHGFFHDLVREVVPSETGIGEPRTLEYLAELLLRFAFTAQLYRFRDLAGRRLFQVAEMLAEAGQPLGEEHAWRERELRQHVGDFTLFWVGVFPEALPRLQARSSLDSLIDYVREGRRAYHQVSLIPDEPYRSQASLFRRLSRHFERLALGLHATRAEWERQAAVNFERLRVSLP
ncbi:MAG: hypothetical protein R3325_01410 [Thermoanaerobaculia bacterium]|nr:hypothetical protein [Thermoanaerobaculia bacterium]